MPEITGTAFEMTFPMMKALPNADTGEIIHHGIASSGDEDLQGERVVQSTVQKSYAYLMTHGKFCLDHRDTDIGEVTQAREIEPEEALRDFGVKLAKSGTYCGGNIYALGGPDAYPPDPADLKTAHYLARKSARMGYSLHGTAMRKSNGELHVSFVPKIAVCSQPVNPTSRLRIITKSLGGLWEHIGVEDTDIPSIVDDLGNAPELLVQCDGPRGATVQPAQVIISKALFDMLVNRAGFTRQSKPQLGNLKRALEALKRSA